MKSIDKVKYEELPKVTKTRDKVEIEDDDQ